MVDKLLRWCFVVIAVLHGILADMHYQHGMDDLALACAVLAVLDVICAWIIKDE